MRQFWPPAEAAQADYEALRATVVAGTPPVGPAATRFARVGLAGLIAHPSAQPTLVASLAGAGRPAWSPHADPRLDALAEAFGLLVAADPQSHHAKEATR